MQLIDALIYGTSMMGFGYVVTMFVLSVTARKITVTVPAGVFSCDADPVTAALVDGYMQTMTAPAMADNVVPFIRPVKHPALDGLSIRELKKLASAAKIRGYSRLSKAELIERLGTVRRAA